MRRLSVIAAIWLSVCGSVALAEESSHEEHAASAQHKEAGHGEEHAGEAGHGEEHGIGAVFHSLEFWATVVNFFVLLFILIRLGRKPMQSFLKSRSENIAKELAEAAELKAAAEKTQKEYADRLKRMDDELESMRKEMIKAGEAERDRIVAEAEEKAARMRKETAFLIEQRMKQMQIDLRRNTIESAIAAASNLLREKASSDDQQRLADQYLKALQQEHNPQPSANSKQSLSSPPLGKARSAL